MKINKKITIMEDLKIKDFFAKLDKIDEIDQKVDKLISGSFHNVNQDEDTFFRTEELVHYLPDISSRYTVYGYVSNRSIPYHKRGNRLLFKKSEIDEWDRNGREIKL